jgi:hypothetical protein
MALKETNSFMEKNATLNNLKRTLTLMREGLIYIEKYQRIYKRVQREAKKKEIMTGMLERQWPEQESCGD